MSSWVTSGDAPPRLSWTCGPVGTSGSAGAGARLGLTILTRRVLASGVHWTSEGRAAAAGGPATATIAAHDGVEAHALDLARLTGGVADPELDAALGGVGEGEAGRVGAPASQGEPGVGGKVDFDLGGL